MSINVKAIKKSVEKAIRVNPTLISLMRINKVDDGYEGFSIDKDNPYIEIVSANIFLNNVTSKKSNTDYSEGGNRDNITGVSALLLYEDSFTVLEGDYFVAGDKKYIVKYAINVYNIYWNLDLEVV